MSNGRPRRRSILSGVLFILAGTLLLLNNFAPEMHLGRWLVDYWPLILILWGLAKLFDYFAARRTGQPGPRTLTGGELLLIILLLGLGAAASGIRELERIHPDLPDVPDVMPDIWGQDYSFTKEIVRPAKAGTQVSIYTNHGDISVYPEETAEIRVLVKKTVKAFEEASAQSEAEQKGNVAVSEASGGYEIKPQADTDNPMAIRVDLEVHAPKKSGIVAHTERGNVKITGVAAPVTATTGSGDIELREIAGDATVELKHGDVRVAGVRGTVRVSGRGGAVEVADVSQQVVIQGEFFGPIRVHNVAQETHFLSQRTDLTLSQLPGRMQMGSGTLEIYDTPGNVSLVTRNKDLTLENVGGRIRIEDRRGNIEVRLPQPPRAEVDIANESGSVELVMPPSSSFEVTATSRQGDVESDFQGPELKMAQDEKSRTLQGKVGNRGPKIQLRTSYGSLRLRKGT